MGSPTSSEGIATQSLWSPVKCGQRCWWWWSPELLSSLKMSVPSSFYSFSVQINRNGDAFFGFLASVRFHVVLHLLLHMTTMVIVVPRTLCANASVGMDLLPKLCFDHDEHFRTLGYYIVL
ncbi:hypothetical protein E3N88_04483 [Mikania micrantha]|uniref:Uncharacterized protein n=1 Tax=Mikania micrantha TaxID=192012 RepID=A0A5N6PUL2_9ASTR|nr:hypothetical protein E3N88_04483 [Mikania micrantha]